MNWEHLQSQLALVLNTEILLQSFSDREWGKIAKQSGQANAKSDHVVKDGTMYWVLSRDLGHVTALYMDEITLSDSERQLISMMIEMARQLERKPKPLNITEDEALAASVRDWIQEALEQGDRTKELPEHLRSLPSLQGTRIPFLLYDSFSGNQSVSYKELKKLLESFFEDEVLLVPLKEREWLILSSDHVMNAAHHEDKTGEPAESVEESLESISSGLHEMIATEWLGECKLAVDYPIAPSQSLLSSILTLREAVFLGTTFYLGSSIHFPWRLHLERLLYRISDEDKKGFLEQILNRSDYLTDAEMLPTLEHFFALDCNVSDTAKQLYIHRNTLLYRLDKFKQETGLDVRNFRDAVLVRIALLLYKVTKR